MKMEEAKSILERNGVSVHETKAYKGGALVTGLVVGTGLMKPTIYGNTFAGINTEAQLMELVEMAINSAPDIHEERLYSTEYVLGHCISCVRPATSDTTAVKWPVLDGEIEEYVRVDVGGDDLDLQMTVVVSWKLLEMLDIAEDELRERARENLRNILEIVPFGEIVTGAGGVALMVPPGGPVEEPFYVITTKTNLHGGGALLQEEFIKEFMKDHAFEDAYLIPSSISEILIMPAIVEKSEVDAMVRDVNRTLAPCDILGYHAFRLRAA